MNNSEGLKSFHQSLYDLFQWVSADCAAGALVPAGITGINIEDDQGSHVRLIVCDGEGRMVGGHGTLNRMPVMILTAISAN
ncbi:hypothetical protein BBP07_15350 [Citrobacter koseri]|nr:hypothetical protein HMPREF0208_00625 [Citrobacter koseri]OHY37104.1 hypothetical protein BBP07_15350 [Citrobacter koseri]